MRMPLFSYVFRPVNDTWVDVKGSEPVVLADVLQSFDILIDDRTQFARLYDYRRGLIIWYRAYGALKITIDIWEMVDGI